VQSQQRSDERDSSYLTILVTGAGGFIGSHVVECLARAGHKVRALVHYNSAGTWGHLSEIPREVRAELDVRLGDVRDAYLVQRLVLDCEVVMHLAALIGIPYSYVAPESYVATNVTGTVHILEACRHSNVQRLIITSTSEVYGTAQYTPIDEVHPLQGQSPYSASKIGADKLAESYFRSFGLPVVTLRPFNTYGPRQSARAIIPTILTQALSGADEIKLGNLTPQRDLTFVGDTARAFLLAASAPGIEGAVIHFGQGKAISVGELAQRCLALTESSAQIRTVQERQRPERSEVDLLVCDPSNAERLLAWIPEISLDTGLRQTTEYVRTHLADYRASEYVV
jgi:NAD dependent epimerase/dehydratase